jgi:hypothetical protein
LTHPFIPNSFQTPNVLVDEVMPLLTPQEWVVLSFATRHILGWHDRIHKRRAPISLSRFEQCGLNRQAILPVLASLEQFRLLRKIGSPNRKGQVWELSFDSGIDLEGLRTRKHHRAAIAHQRTQAARYVRHTGMSHIPGTGMSDTPKRGMSDIPNKDQYKTQDQTQDPPATGVAGMPADLRENEFFLQTGTAASQPRVEDTSARQESQSVTVASKPSTPGSAPPPPSSPHRALIEAYLAALPAPPIQRDNPFKRYGAIAAVMIAAGITPQQVTNYVREQSRTPFWSGKCLSLEYVARNINAWLQAGGKTYHGPEPQTSHSGEGYAGPSAAPRTSPPRPRPLQGFIRGTD